MPVTTEKVLLPDILPFRNLFLKEFNSQVRYNACHERGWSDVYMVKSEDVEVGYGAVKGRDQLASRDALFEFYITPPYKRYASEFFKKLLEITNVQFIECQSNDFLLTSMMFEYGWHIRADVYLFEDEETTSHSPDEVVFRTKDFHDEVFEHNVEPVGNYVLVKQDEIIATGGFALHYNVPFADLYLEVNIPWRNQGAGTFLLQELKKECYRFGYVPVARCSVTNKASKKALINAGMRVVGYMLCGELRNFSNN